MGERPSLRAGVPYYPKLAAMTPFTPATGTRVLLAETVAEADRHGLRAAMFQGAKTIAQETGASSLHLNFLNEDERAAASVVDALLPRVTHQFHFHNEGYASFDDFLARFRSSTRKQVRAGTAPGTRRGLGAGGRERVGSE